MDDSRSEMTYKAPKTIVNHPAVEECIEATASYEGGHDVFLKDGYRFTSGTGAECRGSVFQTVREFLDSCPKRVDNIVQNCILNV